MAITVTNNAVSTLAADISSGSASFSVTSGEGALFPTLSGALYFYVTLEDTSGNVEIVKVTARSSDAFTVTRAQENTAAKAFVAGSRVELRTTAQTIADMITGTIDSTTFVIGDITGLQDALAGKLDASGVSAFGATLIDDTNASVARSTLGLGTMATQNSTAVAITGGTATGITNLAATAGTLTGITNLVATGGSITGITDIAVADGGTGASTASAARDNLGLGTANSPQFTGIELGHASDTSITRVSAGVVAVEGATLAKTSDVVGQQTIWMPAAGMYARTTNGAAAGTLETTTNKVMVKTFDFDTSTNEYAQFAIQMPKGWNEGTLICQFVWSHASTTTNFGVRWTIEGVSLADGDALDTAFGSQVGATDTGGTANTVYISPETTALTVAGSPAAEEYVVFQVSRNTGHASDDLAVDARLHGVKIHYTTDAAKDD